MDALGLVALAAFVVFAASFALAPRFAPDSRDVLRGKERDLALLGVTWDDLHDPPRLPAKSAPSAADPDLAGQERSGTEDPFPLAAD